LIFLNYYDFYQAGESAKVQYRVYSGSWGAWTDRQSWTADVGPTTTTLALSGQVAADQQFQVRFAYNHADSYWWAIDNVQLVGVREGAVPCLTATTSFDTDLNDSEGGAWTPTNVGGDTGANCDWGLRNSQITTPFDATTEAYVDASLCGPGKSCDDRLVSPTYTRNGACTPTLSFALYLNWRKNGDFLRVEYRTWNGTGWDAWVTKTELTVDTGPATQNIDLSGDIAAGTQFQIAFHYTSSNGYDVEIDNISVTGLQ
jgi:hypothetical protein